MSRTRRALRAITPPVVADGVRRLRDRRSDRLPAWEVEPRGWSARDTTRGWDVEGVAAASLARLPDFRAALTGPAILGMGTEAAFPVGASPVSSQHEALVLAYALLQSSRTRSCLSVLDWGEASDSADWLHVQCFPRR